MKPHPTPEHGTMQYADPMAQAACPWGCFSTQALKAGGEAARRLQRQHAAPMPPPRRASTARHTASNLRTYTRTAVGRIRVAAFASLRLAL